MQDNPTKWSIIASGEGANKISFLYYARFHNPSIGDRVLLLNTAKADIKPDEAFKYILSKDPKFQETFNKIERERVCIFGMSPSGAGNNWKVGEDEARKDFDTIRRYMANLGLAEGDAILGINTLSGGTGSGSLPYIIHNLKYGKRGVSGGQNVFLSLGILPYDTEAPHRHFNTVCTLARLLEFEGKQNADMVILADNTQIENSIKSTAMEGTGDEERYYKINEEIIKAVGMLIAPGGKESKFTIDVNDLIQLPRMYGCYHFTPCLSLNNDPTVYQLEGAFETAAMSPMAPIDPKTATLAYFIVRAPKKYVDDKTFTQEGLEELSREWAIENMAGDLGGAVRYCSLVPTQEQKTFDVMILLGGFSMLKMIEKSFKGYYLQRKHLEESASGKEVVMTDDKDSDVSTVINLDDLTKIEKQIKAYVKHTEDAVKRVREGTEDVPSVDDWLRE